MAKPIPRPDKICRRCGGPAWGNYCPGPCWFLDRGLEPPPYCAEPFPFQPKKKPMQIKRDGRGDGRPVFDSQGEPRLFAVD